MKGSVPVALIVRYNVADPSGVGKGTSYLMVSKIGKTESCVTEAVRPTRNKMTRHANWPTRHRAKRARQTNNYGMAI